MPFSIIITVSFIMHIYTTYIQKTETSIHIHCTEN